MKLAVVHLSDIHIRTRQDNCFRRREKLSNRIRFSCEPDEMVLILVTGDVANTGSVREYGLAEEYFRPLFIGLGLDPSESSGRVVFIPGNHDCSFEDVGDLRPRLLKEIESQLETIDVRGETVEKLLQVQSNFFDFHESITSERIPLEHKLYRERAFHLGGKRLEVRCFNSAWLSKRHEDPGSLGFPTATIEAAGSETDADIVISVVHHPSNWLNPSSNHSFRKVVQETSDFLFTGHEHSLGGQLISPFRGSSLVHFESGPLQPVDSGESEFGILHIDLEERIWHHEDYAWSHGAYAKVRVDGPHALSDKTERAASLQISRGFIRQLSDTGTGFLHPRKNNLTLADIFVYPDLKVRKLSQKLTRSDELPKELPSKQVLERILGARRVAVTGPSDSGKTTLSKMLYLEANTRRAKFCLLLQGSKLIGDSPVGAFIAALDEAIFEQYGERAAARYAGLNDSERVLIIDNWEDIRFNRAGRVAIINRASESFGCIIVFVDDIFLIEEISPRHEDAPLAAFEVADLREFGFRLRGQLIRQWHDLGNEFTQDEETVARNVRESTRVIDTVLGRNLLPAYPVNILTLLQTYDAGAGSQHGSLGSYGQVYEALITARLAQVSVKSIDIGTKITFLSRFAWTLFESRQRCIDEGGWTELSRRYCEEYSIRIDGEQLRQALLSAGLLAMDECGTRFAYGYGYCYFVAKYFQENLADLDDQVAKERLIERLRAVSECVYNQDNANIVIFYVFLTKDRSLINFIISNARKIFSEFPEFDFDSQIRFLNQKIGRPRQISLPETKPQINQQIYDQQRDDAGEQLEPKGDPAFGDVRYNSDIPFDQKLVIGIRYLTLMGQILRNFPGSLKADTKLDLAFESYALGLRTLGTVFTLFERDSERLIGEISEILKSKMAFHGTEIQLLNRSEQIVAEMLRQITYGILKRLSHAVGLKELEETYDEVSKLRDNSLANRMIHLSIELDHFERFPLSEIQRLATELEHNNFTYHTLQDLVLNHLYLFPRDYSIQQSAGSTLGMKVNVPGVRGGEKKIIEGKRR